MSGSPGTHLEVYMQGNQRDVERRIEEAKRRIAEIQAQVESRRTVPKRHSTVPVRLPPQNPLLKR